MKIREGSRHTFYFRVEIITNLTILYIPYTAANHQEEQVLATQFSPSQQCHYTSSYSDHRSISNCIANKS
jgi:hypothetical protein